jgi:TRAP-type C4-dicarboxylate transport system permease small subunit
MNAPVRPAEAGWPAPDGVPGRAGQAPGTPEAAPLNGTLLAIRGGLGLVSNLALWLSGVGLVAMTGVVGWQVFARYVLNDTPSWSEPLSLQFMGWFILLGAAVGVRESVHLGLDIVRFAVPEPIGKAMDLASLGLVAAFGVAMAWYSTLLAIGTWTATIPVLGLPGGVDFFPLLLGGVLIALFALERFVDVLLGVAPPVEAEITETV